MTSTNTARPATRILADTVAALTWDDIPDAIRIASRAAVADVIGDVVGNCRDVAVDRSSAALVACGATGDIAVPGRPELLSPFAAAFLTGVAAAVGSRGATLPGAAVVSASLAVAQVTRASGAAVVAAVAVGLETASRIGDALGAPHIERGWDVSGTLGVVGAAVAAGRLSGLSPAQMQHAVALAATQAAGHRAQAGTMAVSLHAGKAAGDGIEAAALAAHGVQGPDAALEGRRGMGVLMADGIDVDRLTSGLGARWTSTFLAGRESVPGIDDLRRRFDARVEPILGAEAATLWSYVCGLEDLESLDLMIASSRLSNQP